MVEGSQEAPHELDAIIDELQAAIVSVAALQAENETLRDALEWCGHQIQERGFGMIDGNEWAEEMERRGVIVAVHPQWFVMAWGQRATDL